MTEQQFASLVMFGFGLLWFVLAELRNRITDQMQKQLDADYRAWTEEIRRTTAVYDEFIALWNYGARDEAVAVMRAYCKSESSGT